MEQSVSNGAASRWDEARRAHRAGQADAIAAGALTLLLDGGAAALTMAAIATAAGVSRQTLYRYYPDVDAVLVGVAELLAAHDDAFAAGVAEHGDPGAQLDVVVRTVAGSEDHHRPSSTELRSALPPEARAVLASHEERIARLVADVLARGMEEGRFRSDLSPATDAPLLLGLAAAAGADRVERALDLVHQLVDRPPEEN